LIGVSFFISSKLESPSAISWSAETKFNSCRPVTGTVVQPAKKMVPTARTNNSLRVFISSEPSVFKTKPLRKPQVSKKVWAKHSGISEHLPYIPALQAGT
jgi:hypothetical protein